MHMYSIEDNPYCNSLSCFNHFNDHVLHILLVLIYT